MNNDTWMKTWFTGDMKTFNEFQSEYISQVNSPTPENDKRQIAIQIFTKYFGKPTPEFLNCYLPHIELITESYSRPQYHQDVQIIKRIPAFPNWLPLEHSREVTNENFTLHDNQPTTTAHSSQHHHQRESSSAKSKNQSNPLISTLHQQLEMAKQKFDPSLQDKIGQIALKLDAIESSISSKGI